jgi:hypothetical protein
MKVKTGLRKMSAEASGSGSVEMAKNPVAMPVVPKRQRPRRSRQVRRVWFSARGTNSGRVRAQHRPQNPRKEAEEGGEEEDGEDGEEERVLA